jgi:hypothetical protein
VDVASKTTDFHHHRKKAKIWKALEAKGFTTDKSRSHGNRKRYDGIIEEDGKRVAVEIESSTIENAYNDVLKILAGIEQKEIDFGVILAKYNRRRKSLDYEQFKECLWVPFAPVIKERLSILCVRSTQPNRRNLTLRE